MDDSSIWFLRMQETRRRQRRAKERIGFSQQDSCWLISSAQAMAMMGVFFLFFLILGALCWEPNLELPALCARREIASSSATSKSDTGINHNYALNAGEENWFAKTGNTSLSTSVFWGPEISPYWYQIDMTYLAPDQRKHKFNLSIAYFWIILVP